MPSKPIKIFCKLSTYVKQEDPNFFTVFNDLCIDHYLRPIRGSNGITFLYPKDKKYRDKIVNAAHSLDPSVAVNMIKALIIKDFMPGPMSFGSNVVNLLDQKLQIKDTTEKGVKLENGLELTLDKSFIPMGHRANMAVYIISGSGNIPINGPSADVEKVVKTTGGKASPSGKAQLHKFLEDVYIREIGKVDNFYVKKVYLQLKCLSDHNHEDVCKFLGNDEFSDSYLLDMYCTEKCPESFITILDCLTKSDKVTKITKGKYIEIKKVFCGDKKNSESDKDQKRLYKIESPMDFKTEVLSRYNDDERAGKDLFIVFCNICRDLWQTDVDKVGNFKNFAYLAANCYTSAKDILLKDYDTAQYMTLYGNLLKSDVFMYVPQASFDTTNAPKSIPAPCYKSIYSLSEFINKPLYTGGDPSSDFLVEDL